MVQKIPLAYDRQLLAELTYLGSRISNMAAVVNTQLLHDDRRYDIELNLLMEQMFKLYNRAQLPNVSCETEGTVQ